MSKAHLLTLTGAKTGGLGGTKSQGASELSKMDKEVPDRVKSFTSQGKITEGHLCEIYDLQLNLYLSPWLTTEEIYN